MCVCVCVSACTLCVCVCCTWNGKNWYNNDIVCGKIKLIQLMDINGVNNLMLCDDYTGVENTV